MQLHVNQWVYVETPSSYKTNKYLKGKITRVEELYIVIEVVPGHGMSCPKSAVIKITHKDAPLWIDRD